MKYKIKNQIVNSVLCFKLVKWKYFISATLFFLFVSVQPVIFEVQAAAVAGYALAISALLTIGLWGAHVNSDGQSNWEKTGNLIINDYKYWCEEQVTTGIPGDNIVYKNRFHELVSMWRDGVLDISSDAYKQYKYWLSTLQYNSTSSDAITGGTYFDSGSLFYVSNLVSSESIIFDLSSSSFQGSGFIIPSNFSGFSIYYNSSWTHVSKSYFFKDVSGNFYLICKSDSNLNRHNTFYTYNNGKYSYFEFSMTFSSGYIYYNLNSHVSSYGLSQFYDTFENSEYTLNEVLSRLRNDSISPDDSVPDKEYSISLPDNELTQELFNNAQTLLSDDASRAKYISDMLNEYKEDGSSYVNLLDGTIPFGGDIDSTGEALLDGTYPASEVANEFGIVRTVQGILDDSIPYNPSLDVATPTDIADSVPIVINPDFTIPDIITPFTPVNSYGGDFSFPLSNYFPFSVPFDVVRLVRFFNAPAVAPKITFKPSNLFIGITSKWAGTDGKEGDLIYRDGDNLTLDLSPFNPVADIGRKVIYITVVIIVALNIRKWLHGGD